MKNHTLNKQGLPILDRPHYQVAIPEGHSCRHWRLMAPAKGEDPDYLCIVCKKPRREEAYEALKQRMAMPRAKAASVQRS